MHAKLTAACALASNKIQVMADALVYVGCDNFQTKDMEKLIVAGRRKPCGDAFDGPHGITYMWNCPELLKTIFDVNDPDEKKCMQQLLQGWALMRRTHKLMLCICPEKFTALGGPAALWVAARELNAWVWAFTAAVTHPRLTKDGRAHYNSACHNMLHVCEMADVLWKDKIAIGMTTEQGPEAMNKTLEKELGSGLGKHGNGHMNSNLSDNMLANGLKHVHRSQFQHNLRPMRKDNTCTLCRKCVPDCAVADRCVRWPDCQDDIKSPVKLPHSQVGARCWHSHKYRASSHFRDIVPMLDTIQALF